MSGVDRTEGGHPPDRRLRVGLQVKSALVLTLIVITVTIAGGWFYFDTVRTWLRDSDHRHAMRVGQALALGAAEHLAERDFAQLQDLAGNSARLDNVLFIALLDERGRVVASSARDGKPGAWSGLLALPTSVSGVAQVSDDTLTFACPVVQDGAEGSTLLGAVRLVVDTRSTTADLAGVARRTNVIAAVITLCAIPLGYLLVWRVMILPIRRLVGVARRLAEGDFAARTAQESNDEIRELETALNAMAGQVSKMRNELLGANERLERQVERRTGELELANRRLREEMVEKEEFLRAVSHDLNAPLRNIAGMATMLMMKWRDELPEEVIARLQRMQVNVDVGSELIEELLELSRVKTRPQKRRTVDMQELLGSLAETFEYELKERDIELRIDGWMPSLYLERSRIRQVFQNLVDNAIKYMDRPSGGVIGIGYVRADGMHQFRVSDNGPGVPPELQEKIFCVFRRGGSVRGARIDGKGVGLALVKTVVSNYDGRAWVESEPPDGSTFCVGLGEHCTRPPDGTDDDLESQGAREDSLRAVGG